MNRKCGALKMIAQNFKGGTDLKRSPVNVSTPVLVNKPCVDFGSITPITPGSQRPNKKCKKSISFITEDELNHMNLLKADESDLEAFDLAVAEQEYYSSHSQEKIPEQLNATSDIDVKQPSEWLDETFLEQVVRQTDISSQRITIGDRIREALLSNASKSVTNRSKSPADNVKNEENIQSNSPYFSLGPFFDLPSKVKLLIQETKGIKELYSWQEDCLKLEAVSKRKNLVFALPTSGGKTLVAEILMLREILCRKHNVLFVLPYVAIVQEKVRSLSPIAVALNFFLEEYAASKGKYPPRKRRYKNSLYIATIEKALNLVSSLIETDRLSELGLVVVDELHLLGESGGRGAHLEILLTKLLYSAGDKIHIVGMSATIGNLHEVSTFLKAETYVQNFRPVELIEYVKCEDQIFCVNGKVAQGDELLVFKRKIKSLAPKLDPDHLGTLVLEVVPNDSVLVFCPSKKNCENVALLICQILPQELQNHKSDKRAALYRALAAETNGSLCQVMKKTLPFGVAYHHSGLTTDERRLLEEAFLDGTLCCICCTSTLAAGVNLPAARVILRSPYIGTDFINLSRYKQMVGRAGRAGMGTKGESFLLCTPRDAHKVRDLLYSCMDSCESSLLENENNGIKTLVISGVMQRMANTRNALYQLIDCTLLKVQAERKKLNLKEKVDDAVKDLFSLNALICKDSGYKVEASVQNLSTSGNISFSLHRDAQLAVSRLGVAAMKGSMDLNTAQVLYDDLMKAQEGLVLSNSLHLLFVVTPYDFVGKIKPNTNVYYSVYNSLDPKEQLVAHRLGINEVCMVRIVKGQSYKNVSEHTVGRFYLTLMLYELWQQKDISDVALKYQVDRGFVQSLVSTAASFSMCVIRFCEELEEMWAYKALLTVFSQRLSYCCTLELIPLMDLPAVKRGRAKQLYNAGFKTLQDIANSNVRTLVTSVEHLSRKVANQIIAAAKMLLLEKVESLRDEAEEVLEGLNAPMIY